MPMAEILDTFCYNLEVLIKTAVASYSISLSENSYESGMNVFPEPGDVVVKPPFVFGVLLAKIDEITGNPWFSYFVTDDKLGDPVVRE